MAAPGRDKPATPRQAPLDGPALKAALLDGLRFHALATGSPVAGNAAELVEHQLAAIRRACKRVDPPDVHTRPPLALTADPAPEPEPPQLLWWNRD